MALAPPPSAILSASLRCEHSPDAVTGTPPKWGQPARAATLRLADDSPLPRTHAASPLHDGRRLGSPAQNVLGPTLTALTPHTGQRQQRIMGRRRVQSARPFAGTAPRVGAASPVLRETAFIVQRRQLDILRARGLQRNLTTATEGVSSGTSNGVLPRIGSGLNARPHAAPRHPRTVSTQQVARNPRAGPSYNTPPIPPVHVNPCPRQTRARLHVGTKTAQACEPVEDRRLPIGANANGAGRPVGATACAVVTDVSGADVEASCPELPAMQLTAAVQRLTAGTGRSRSERAINPTRGPVAMLRESLPGGTTGRPRSTLLVRPKTLASKLKPSSGEVKVSGTKTSEKKLSASKVRGCPGGTLVLRLGVRLAGKGSGAAVVRLGQGRSGCEQGRRAWRAVSPDSVGSGECGQDGEETEDEDGSEAVEFDGSEDSSAQSVDLDGNNDDEEEELPDGPDEGDYEVDVSDDASSGDDGGDYTATLDLAVSTTLCSVQDGIEDGKPKPALVPSMFDNVPPTVYFGTEEELIAPLPRALRTRLKWKMSAVTPRVVKRTVARSHFRPTNNSHDWLGCWGRHMKSPGFRALREYQKLNHFPGSFQIGRKDRLWRNLSRLRARFGHREFGFVPRSFVLPQDTRALRLAWDGRGATAGTGARHRWIVKPPASARGIGIKVISKWCQLPKKRPLLVQRYLHKPYLIDGSKFDLRVYVYVTSYDPLRIYVFEDGLVRFASCKYSPSAKTLGNRFMHLTNYSVNKNNAAYKSNGDRMQCEGHKWALKALWGYLCDKGVDWRPIWEQIKDISVKTIIASEQFVSSLLAQFVGNRRSCHELFGFDIMLDERLKPWLLEVNISPSLHSNSPLDIAVKGQMIKDLLNLAGFQIPSGVQRQGGADGGRTGSDVTANERSKHAFYLSPRGIDERGSLLDTLTPGDVRALVEAEDELRRRGRFERAFPSPSPRYFTFFVQQRYQDLLLHRWVLTHPPGSSAGVDLLKRLCKKGVHLGPTEDHIWTPSSRLEPRPRAAVPSGSASSRAAKSHAKQPDEPEKVVPSRLQVCGPQVCGITSSLGSLALSQTPAIH